MKPRVLKARAKGLNGLKVKDLDPEVYRLWLERDKEPEELPLVGFSDEYIDDPTESWDKNILAKEILDKISTQVN